jgi:hypothetical protein
MNDKRVRVPALIVVGALLLSRPVIAHHGGATLYDLKKEVTLKATITEFVWANPHVEIGFDGVDAKGKVSHWLLENNSTPVLVTRGWSRRTLKYGDVVTITFNPGLKANIGKVVKIVWPDGKEMR